MQDEWRNDEEVQVAAQTLFLGVVPERRADLQALWQQYNPRFNLLLDKTPDGLFVMEGGLYRDVNFMDLLQKSGERFSIMRRFFRTAPGLGSRA
jgi:hypothetical protein